MSNKLNTVNDALLFISELQLTQWAHIVKKTHSGHQYLVGVPYLNNKTFKTKFKRINKLTFKQLLKKNYIKEIASYDRQKVFIPTTKGLTKTKSIKCEKTYKKISNLYKLWVTTLRIPPTYINRIPPNEIQIPPNEIQIAPNETIDCTTMMD